MSATPTYAVRPDGTVDVASPEDALILARRMASRRRVGDRGAVIAIDLSHDPATRRWHAFADSDFGCASAEGKSQSMAVSRVLTAMVRKVYERMDDGTIALNDVFPLAYEEREVTK